MSNLNVKDYRHMANLTQKAMAELLGIPTSLYNCKENGKRKFSIAEYKALKNILQVHIDGRGIKLDHQITIDDLVG